MISKVDEYMPGALGRITELHARYYHRYWGFDLYFEAKVATEMVEFLQHGHPARDGLWVAIVDHQIVGSIAINGQEADTRGARLRWLIVAPEHQGRGLGRRLIREAIAFCRQARFRRIFLTTFAGLHAARHLYEQEGFLLIHEQADHHWGKRVLEQTFDLVL